MHVCNVIAVCNDLCVSTHARARTRRHTVLVIGSNRPQLLPARMHIGRGLRSGV